MFRPILAFATLCLAAFLLAPTVASVHEKVTELNIMRETPWSLFQWHEPPQPHLPLPNCGGSPRQLYSEVKEWPERIQKDEPFMLSGVVQNEAEGMAGVATIEVDLFLNETKTEPGIFLGSTESNGVGIFTLNTSLPFELQASRYHLVAHAKTKQMGCIRYLEHWSDPETDIVSTSTITWDALPHVVIGRNTTFSGSVLDVVGAPVRNVTVNVTIEGKTTKVVTDESGFFRVPHTPTKAGDLKVNASFKGSQYYTGSWNASTIKVAEELFLIDGGQNVTLQRSTPLTLAGSLFVADDVRQDSFNLSFEGVQVSTCKECPSSSSLRVPVDESGAWRVDVVVGSDAEPGPYAYKAAGGGLKKSYAGNATLHVQPTLTLEADGTSLFGKGLEARMVLADEVGRPLSMPVALATPDAWHSGTSDAEGVFTFSGEAPACGPQQTVGFFNGTADGGYLPARADAKPYACGFLAFVPPWLLATPWWVWPLLGVLAFGAWQAYRGWRQRYAPVIMGGPSLTFAFTEPRDEAAGYAGIGEAVVATAFLEEPLPDGHRLRIGSPRRTEERPIDADLRAHYRLVPDKLGDLPLRAEVLDAKGRVVSRRALTLHVVRYAEEIEKRYLALRSSHGAGDAVTPREFERWLHERAPGLDAAIARRLVHVFEEADYSPRVAGRAEFAAYMMAERGVQEVTPIVRT